MSDNPQDLEARVAELEAQVDQLNKDLLDTQLDDWKARIDSLEVQMHLGSMEAREELNPLLEQLRNRWLDAQELLDKAGSAAGDAVNSLSDGARKAFRDLTRALDDAVDKLKP